MCSLVFQKDIHFASYAGIGINFEFILNLRFEFTLNYFHVIIVILPYIIYNADNEAKTLLLLGKGVYFYILVYRHNEKHNKASEHKRNMTVVFCP